MDSKDKLRAKPLSLGDLTGALVEDSPQMVYQDNPNAIVPVTENTMAYKRVLFTDHGLEYPYDFTEFEWADVGFVLKRLEGVVAWNIADWAAIAVDTLKMSYTEIAARFGYEPETIELYASIARNVLPQVRLISNQPLPFSHARVIAPLSKNIILQEALASYAIHFNLKVEEFKLHKWLLNDLQWEMACWRIKESIRDNTPLNLYVDFAAKLTRRQRRPSVVIAQVNKDAALLKKGYENPAALKGKKLIAAREAVTRLRAWLDEFESQLSDNG